MIDKTSLVHHMRSKVHKRRCVLSENEKSHEAFLFFVVVVAVFESHARVRSIARCPPKHNHDNNSTQTSM